MVLPEKDPMNRRQPTCVKVRLFARPMLMFLQDREFQGKFPDPGRIL